MSMLENLIESLEVAGMAVLGFDDNEVLINRGLQTVEIGETNNGKI